MTTDNWISLAGIIIQIVIAVITFFITRHQLSTNDKRIKLDTLLSKLDGIRGKSCEYWGKQSMTPGYQKMLEINIKSDFEDIKFLLKGLHDNTFKSIKQQEIHKIQTNDYVDLNKLITGGSFETKTRVCDINKCDTIIKNISALKEKIESLK